MNVIYYPLPQSVTNLDSRRTQIDPVFRLDAPVHVVATGVDLELCAPWPESIFMFQLGGNSL